jgi:formylglycine-generating enzyme required for sulfatase activity
MVAKVVRSSLLVLLLMVPSALYSQQGAAPAKDKGSVDHLGAEDFAPKPKPAKVAPNKPRQRPSKPASSAVSQETIETSKGHSPGEVWREPVTGMEMVWVPAGCYQMGCGSWTSDCSNDERPVHEVCLDGFWLGKYEVTRGEWQKVMGSNPSFHKSGENHPAAYVSWNDVQAFIRRLRDADGGKYEFRLPSEAEWEYACRSGGKNEKFAGGGSVESVGWYDKNSGPSTHKVGMKSANGLGIYDMTGNVWEWVHDVYEGSAYGKHERRNPLVTSGGSGRVGRGGSWGNDAANARCTVRFHTSPASRSVYLGFRLARTN